MQWTLQELEQSFDLKRPMEIPALKNWMSVTGEFMPTELERMEELRANVFQQSDYWSEEELKFYMIAPIIHLAHFHDPLRFFAGRSLTATVGEYELTGIVDGMVATGHYSPQMPYFCLHEYKPQEAGRQEDPAAQALSAMLAARQLNQSTEPVLGAYVLGRFWFFLALSGDEYSISIDFSTAKIEELKKIVLILRKLNVIFAKPAAATLSAA